MGDLKKKFKSEWGNAATRILYTSEEMGVATRTYTSEEMGVATHTYTSEEMGVATSVYPLTLLLDRSNLSKLMLP